MQKSKNSKVGEKQSPEAGKWRATAQGKDKEKVKISYIQDLVRKSSVEIEKFETRGEIKVQKLESGERKHKEKLKRKLRFLISKIRCCYSNMKIVVKVLYHCLIEKPIANVVNN